MSATDWSNQSDDSKRREELLAKSDSFLSPLRFRQSLNGSSLPQGEAHSSVARFSHHSPFAPAEELHHSLDIADTLFRFAKAQRNQNAAPPSPDKMPFFLTFLLRYVVLAPSSRNAQPWRWRIAGNSLELFADQHRSLPISDPHDRELLMSCGAALFYARLAMRHFGYACHVEYFPQPKDPDLLARITVGEPHPAHYHEEDLFYAIARRHTNRGAFRDEPLPASLLETLQDEAEREESSLRVVDGFTLEGAVAREKISDLIVRGTIVVLRDRAVRREWAMWMRNGQSARRDGLPPEALGVHPGKVWLLNFAWQYLDPSEQQADRNRELAASAPALCVLSTRSNSPRAWLRGGEALARVLLRAATVGLSASFFNEPLRDSAMATQIKQVLDCDGYPQLLFRLGIPVHQTPATPRRPVSEVLLQRH